MNKYKVVEKFVSVDGEGIRVGYPVVFIRLAGCNLSCKYCDSLYANDNPKYEVMTTQQILDYIISTGFKMVTLTGGEPLIHPGIETLIDTLIANNFDVNIETNGAVDIQDINENALITMDYKCPSSGMEDKMLLDNFDYLNSTDVLKFVVGSQEDLLKAKEIIEKYNIECEIFFSPVFGDIEPKEIVKFIIDNKMQNVRMQLQIHKFIWNPLKRGV